MCEEDSGKKNATLLVPALNETSNQELTEISLSCRERTRRLMELYSSFSREASKITERYEFIFVVQDGFEQAYQVAKSLRATDPRVRVLRLQGQSGESTALMVGFEKARGKLIFTLSAYFQVDPTEFAKVYLSLKDDCDLVITAQVSSGETRA